MTFRLHQRMVIKNQCLCPISVPKVTGTTARILRCGWCPNCLKQKANELVVRTVREVEGKQIAFLTFTYRPEDCPIQITNFIADENGEYVVKTSIERDSDKYFHNNAPFDWVTNKNGKRSKRYKPLCQELDNGLRFSYYTVYFKDFQKMLKRYRIKHPGTLNTFIAVPEYGGLTYRPHYHILVVGLSELQINDLVAEWPYGDVDIDLCNREDRTNDPKKIASYISKYCNKGKYDCPYIREGKCIKPRRSISKNFGIGTLEQFKELKNNLLGGSYCHTPDPWSNFDLPQSPKQLHYLASQRKYLINNYPYPMPKYLINKVFKKTIKSVQYNDSYNQKRVALFECPLSKLDKSRLQTIKEFDPNCKIRYHQVSSPLQKQITSVVLADLVVSALRQQEKDKRVYQSMGNIPQLVSDIQFDEKNTLQAVEKSFIQDLANTSIF